ncbi:MAG: DMT family transporter [Promethearchaeota archaeon]
MFQVALPPFNLTIGILLSVVSSVLFAMGIILQKKAVMEMPEIKLNEINSMTRMVKNKTWLLGILLALAGGPTYIVAQAFIGVTLGQPLMLALQLVFTVIFAIRMLKEKIHLVEGIGFILLIISPIFLVLGQITAPRVNIASSEYINNFLIFLIPITIICIVSFILIKFAKEYSAGILYAIISGVIFALGANMAQSGVEIVKNQIELIVLGLIFLLLVLLGNTFATVIQQLAFQKGRAGILIGIQGTANLLLAIYGGMLIFNQKILSPWFFIVGILFILIGNILLIQFQTRLEEIETQGIESADILKEINETKT